MLNIFLISVIVVIIIDLSGFIESIKSGLKYIVTKGRMSGSDYRLKPLDCSFCMTFWTGLVYLLVTHTFTLWMLTYLLLTCVMTIFIKDVIVTFRGLLQYIIKKLYEVIQ